jgi:hypothetical protein
VGRRLTFRIEHLSDPIRVRLAEAPRSGKAPGARYGRCALSESGWECPGLGLTVGHPHFGQCQMRQAGHGVSPHPALIRLVLSAWLVFQLETHLNLDIAILGWIGER